METQIACRKEETHVTLSAGNLRIALSHALMSSLYLLVDALATETNDLAEAAGTLLTLAQIAHSVTFISVEGHCTRGIWAENRYNFITTVRTLH